MGEAMENGKPKRNLAEQLNEIEQGLESGTESWGNITVSAEMLGRLRKGEEISLQGQQTDADIEQRVTLKHGDDKEDAIVKRKEFNENGTVDIGVVKADDR